jgi:hypothetical protein
VEAACARRATASAGGAAPRSRRAPRQVGLRFDGDVRRLRDLREREFGARLEANEAGQRLARELRGGRGLDEDERRGGEARLEPRLLRDRSGARLPPAGHVREQPLQQAHRLERDLSELPGVQRGEVALDLDREVLLGGPSTRERRSSSPSAACNPSTSPKPTKIGWSWSRRLH